MQTIVTDLDYGLTHKEIAEEYEIDIEQVNEEQAFYHAHKLEIDTIKKVEDNIHPITFVDS